MQQLPDPTLADPIPAAAIDYATDTAEVAPDRFLRRVVAWTAMLHGGQSVLTAAVHIALSRKWLASPPNMSWEPAEGWALIVSRAQTLSMAALLVGGVLLLRRSRGRPDPPRRRRRLDRPQPPRRRDPLSPTWASYWSTPGAAAINASSLLHGLWLPALLVLLTLPPLARRVV